MKPVYQQLQDVETSSAQLRRLYRTIRETMRAMAGRIAGVESWEAKKLLARHIWLDAEHADAIRDRVLELRFPRVDVDVEADKALNRLIARLPCTSTDAEFLAGVYKVIKPAVQTSIEAYLRQSDPLGDAPSHRVLRSVQRELQEQFTEFERCWADLSPDSRIASEGWVSWMYDSLAAAGGLPGPDTGVPLLNCPGYSDRPEYTVPALPKRDPRWLPAITQVPPRPPRTPQEQQIWVAIDHVNELWACELPAALIWHYEGLPWDLYRDTARWAYDEMRHAMLGERRLLAYGFEVGVDIPMVPDHWMGIGARGGLEAMLFAVHGLEQGGPKWKAQLKQDLWAMGDPYSAQDCDYDWADEAGHIRYGQDWLKALFPHTPKSELIARTEREVALWKEWIAERHRTGQHGYDAFMQRIEAKCSRMPGLARPELFEPRGSSAATASYGLGG